MSRPAPFSCLEALEPRLAPAGIVTVSFSGGTLSLTGDADANRVQIYDNGNGTWTLRDANNADTAFRYAGMTETALQLIVTAAPNLKVNFQGGDDALVLDGIRVTGGITIADNASEGSDSILFLSTTVNGPTKIDLGGGTDSFMTQNTVFNGLLTLKGGTGIDTYHIGHGSYRGITVDMGTGSDIFNLANDPEAPASLGPVRIIGSLNITSQATADETTTVVISTPETYITGSVSIKTGNGHGILKLGRTAGDSLQVLGGFSYTGGKGDDLIVLTQNIGIGGKLDLKTGIGQNTLITFNQDTLADNDLIRLTLGALSYTGGTSANQVVFNDGLIHIDGDAAFSLGNGSNEVTFGDDTEVFVAGKLTYKGGSNINLLDFQSSSLHILGALTFSGSGIGSGFNTLNVGPAYGVLGSVSYIGGSSSDFLYVGGYTDYTTGNLRILGKVTANLGTGNNNAYLTDAEVYGNVSLISATNDLGGGNSYENLGIRDSFVVGTTTIKSTGSIGGTYRLHNSTFQGAVTVDTGKGADTVYLDTPVPGSGNTLSKNYFQAAVRILLGAGDDRLDVNPQQENLYRGNLFNTTFFADGGTGVNIAVGINAPGNEFTTPAVLKKFTSIS